MKLTKEQFIAVASCYGDTRKEDNGYSCYVPVCRTFGWKLNYYDLVNSLTISAVVHNGVKSESESIVTDFDITKEKLLKLLDMLTSIHKDLATILFA